MKKNKPAFFAVDFYCGAGGTTRGLLDAGGFVICGIDKDANYEETYQRNNRNSYLDQEHPRFLAYDMFPASDAYPEGEQHKIWDELRDLIPRYRAVARDVPLLFVICAPCQSFTRFVQRQMTEERTKGRDRDLGLLAQTLTFIAEFEPEMVISENVANIRTGKYRHVWVGFEQALRDLGYAVNEDRVCASRFGVPQYRRRSVMLALRNDEAVGLVSKPSIPLSDPAAPTVNTSQAIGHLPTLEAGERSQRVPNHACRNLIELNKQRLMSVAPGDPNWSFTETPYGDLSLACHRRLEAKGTRGFGDVYTRMHPDRPAPTMTTRFHSVSNGRFGHYDRNQVRGISLREGAILQSFPEDYAFYGEGMDAIARMIGNAVPPKLSAYMANWLYQLWQERNATTPNSVPTA